MKRYKLAIDFDCRDMEAVARPAADGEYVLATEAQAQIDLLRTALEDVVRPCVGEPREDCSHCRARAALEQTKP